MDDKNERERRSNGDDDHEVSNNNINKRKKKMMNKMRLSNILFIRGKMGIKRHTVRTRRRILRHIYTYINTYTIDDDTFPLVHDQALRALTKIQLYQIHSLTFTTVVSL
ncbi:hypothetical protein ACFE04_026604 [Oxalis oulophora]